MAAGYFHMMSLPGETQQHGLTNIALEKNHSFDRWANAILLDGDKTSILSTMLTQYMAVTTSTEDVQLRQSIVAFATTLVWAAALSTTRSRPVPIGDIINIVKLTILIIYCDIRQEAHEIDSALYSLFQHDALVQWIHKTQTAMLVFRKNLESIAAFPAEATRCSNIAQQVLLESYTAPMLESDRLLVHVLLDPRVVPRTATMGHCWPEERETPAQVPQRDILYMLKAMGVLGSETEPDSTGEYARMRRVLDTLIETNISSAHWKHNGASTPASPSLNILRQNM